MVRVTSFYHFYLFILSLFILYPSFGHWVSTTIQGRDRYTEGRKEGRGDGWRVVRRRRRKERTSVVQWEWRRRWERKRKGRNTAAQTNDLCPALFRRVYLALSTDWLTDWVNKGIELSDGLNLIEEWKRGYVFVDLKFLSCLLFFFCGWVNKK